MPPEPDTIKILSVSVEICSLQQPFQHLGVCKVAHYWHRNSSVRQDHVRPFTHHVWVMHTHKHTDNQKWKLQQKASQHHPGDNTEIRKHMWLTLVSLSRNYHLLQSLWGELVTTGKQVKKKVPHLLKLRNNGSNFFTINTNRILGVRKLSMILKASDLVC